MASSATNHRRPSIGMMSSIFTQRNPFILTEEGNQNDALSPDNDKRSASFNSSDAGSENENCGVETELQQNIFIKNNNSTKDGQNDDGRDINASKEVANDNDVEQTPLVAELLKENNNLRTNVQNLELRLSRLEKSHKNLSTTTSSSRYFSFDTFTFMAISPIRSTPFVSAIMIFICQILAFTLLAIDIIDIDAKDNPIGVPANVNWEVRAAQLLAILIASVTQDDIREAMTLVNEGFDDNSLRRGFSDISYQKWVFSLTCRFLEGGLGLVVTFFLIVIAETVFDLLLNFTAVEFVSQLDNVAFEVSKLGYGGEANKEAARTISETPHSTDMGQRYRVSPMLLLLLIIASMLGGWVYVVHQQLSGAFLRNSIFMQGSADFLPQLGTFTGFYDLDDSKKFHKRATYVERRSGKAMLAYCRSERAWTFSYAYDDNEIDPCKWYAKSEETFTFDILTTVPSRWIVQNEDGRESSMQHFHIDNAECSDDIFCNSHGSCVNGLCSCDVGWFGLHCEFLEEPCASLEVDEQFDGFLGTRNWPTKYNILQDENNSIVEVYNRAVYVSKFLEDDQRGIMMFTGRRWVLTLSGQLQDLANSAAANETLVLANYIKNTFHAHWSNYSVEFISDPVDVNSPTDALTPRGLSWFHANDKDKFRIGIQTVDSTRPSEAVLLCAVCDNQTNPCLFNGKCGGDRNCLCALGFLGTLCQLPPIGNGRCDQPILNTPEFSFDGGDCCGYTCISSKEFTCGKTNQGYTDIGYFFCDTRQSPMNTWVARGLPISSDNTFARSGTSVALSSNGNILAVGEPGSDSVRLFGKSGAEWIQRGLPIQGPPDSDFGSSVSIAVENPRIVDNPTTLAPVVLAVGARGMVRVFHCTIQKCSQIGNDLLGTVSTLSLSGNGRVIAVGNHSANNFVVFERNGGMDWNERISMTRRKLYPRRSLFAQTVDLKGYYVSISRTGDMLAVGSMHYVEEINFETYETSFIGSASLEVQVYVWEIDQNTSGWVIRGSTITDSSNLQLFPTEFPSQAVALSADALVLAVGSTIYYWDGAEWVGRGDVIAGLDKQGLEGGWSVDLSWDGSVVAYGSDAFIRTFQWNASSNKYEQLWNDIEGGETSALSLSSNGRVLAVGLPHSRENRGGTTTVFDYILPSMCVGNTSSLFHLSLTTDSNPGETTWELRTLVSGELLLSGGPYSSLDFATVVEEKCLDLSECSIFTIYDSGLNGINDPGGYILLLNGVKMPKEFVYKIEYQASFHRYYIGKNCVCPEGNLNFRLDVNNGGAFGASTWWRINELRESETILTGKSSHHLTGTVVEEYCIQMPTCALFSISMNQGGSNALIGNCFRTPNPVPPISYNFSLNGNTKGSGFTGGRCYREVHYPVGDCACPERTSHIRLELSNDFSNYDYYFSGNLEPILLDNVSWTIEGLFGGGIILEGGPYESAYHHIVDTCIEIPDCATFSITGGDMCNGPRMSGPIPKLKLLQDNVSIHESDTFCPQNVLLGYDCPPTLAPTS